MSRRASPFGRQVRALRLAAGLTQAELAEAAGISERTVSDLERGARTAVYAATARQLASALQVEQDRLAPFLLAAHGLTKAEPEPSVNVRPPPAARRSRPPFRLTRLIGREEELELVRRLALDGPRLVTLVGPGGVGKTRLAAEVAATTHEQFTAGSWFVDLSPLDDPRMVLTTIATNVGVQPGIGELVEALTRRLAADRVLVVLDTFEHVLAAAADVADLVGACPGLVVLATSRSALNVRGEREVLLRPLAVRAGAVGEPTPAPAVELFLERARAAAAEVSATPAALDAVAGICARLDGLPLAIELAAARVKHMSIADLRANLDCSLDTLSGGARDLPARHQTMRAALDWSHALLGGSEMRLFRELSVFRGGFGRDAAGAIAAADDPSRHSDVLETLSALVNCSLVVVQTAPSGEARYRLLDLVREYAVEKAVAAGDLEALRQRHAEHYLALAERAEPRLRGRGQQEWYERLLDDESNFRAALGWALEAEETEVALRLVGALWMFWRWAGLFTEGRAWLEAALASGGACSPAARCQALWGAGWLAYHQGDYRRCHDAGRQMLQLLGEGDSGLDRRNALTLVGNAALAEGRTDDALAPLGEALTICERLGRGWHLGTSLLNLGTAMLRRGRIAEAKGFFERALTEYEGLGDRHFVARTLIQLGQTALADGQDGEGAAHIRHAVEISAELGDAWSIAEALEAVVNLRSSDRPDTAAMLAGAAERLREQIAMRPHPADAVINSGHLDAVRHLIGQVAFDAAWAEGRDAPLKSAVGIALMSSWHEESAEPSPAGRGRP